MQSIFLASSFLQGDRELVGFIEKVSGAFGIELKKGSSLGGEPLEPEIEKRIESSDALIALFTKREEDDHWPTHPWVLGEYGHAVSIKKQAIAIVENTVDWSKTKHNAREMIELDRGNPGPAIVTLVEQIGAWRKQSAEKRLTSSASTQARHHAERVITPEANSFVKRSLRFIAKNDRSLLNDALRAKDIALTGWAAEAFLNTRLDALDKREPPTLDAEYITNAEYQLFLEDMRARGDSREPDFWQSERFPDGQGLQPILGVRGPGRDSDEKSADTNDFCKWLTERRKNGRRYRVPLQLDLQHLKSDSKNSSKIGRNDDIAFWYKKSDEESGLYWNVEEENSEHHNRGWIYYKERLLSRDPFGKAVDFSPQIYSEAQVIGLLESATDWRSLIPIEEFALSRDKKRFEKRDDQRSLLEDQFIYVCWCLEQIKRNVLDRQVSDALRHFGRESGGASMEEVLKKFKGIRDTYATKVETDDEVKEGFGALQALMEAMCKTEFYSARKAWREYAIRLLRLRIDAQRSVIRQADWNKDKTCNILRQVYWWLRILQLREEERFEAWEGIRIVSDRR